MRIFIIIFLVLPFSVGAQCLLDRHNTSAESGWKSCTTAPNPNPLRGNNHWILYDFSWDYYLEQVHLWNHNHPETLDDGVRDYVIDISTDGINWQEIYSDQMAQATGLSSYEGVPGPVVNQRARFLLITALTNYGGSCTALGEIRIDVGDDLDCQDYNSLTGDLGNRIYYADQLINSDGLVNENKVVHFRAEDQINIMNGFEAKLNSEFIIQMIQCVD